MGDRRWTQNQQTVQELKRAQFKGGPETKPHTERSIKKGDNNTLGFHFLQNLHFLHLLKLSVELSRKSASS